MVEKMELERRGEDERHIPWDKLLGVAILGAVGSAVLYYVFLQFPDEKREALKDSVVSFVKNNATKFFVPQGETEV